MKTDKYDKYDNMIIMKTDKYVIIIYITIL